MMNTKELLPNSESVFEILCRINFKCGKISEEMVITKTFLFEGLVGLLYQNYADDWESCESFFMDTMNVAYGQLLNNEKTKEKIAIKLTRQDFDKVVYDNCMIKCILQLKSEPNNPTTYLITKKALLEDFVRDMFDLHGDDWISFETFFVDTGNYAYGTISNNRYLKENQFLTFADLKRNRYKLNKQEWKRQKFGQVERFYILYFDDQIFIKIGHAFREIEKRLYNYLFPSSLNERLLYEGKVIDFSKSYLLETNITLAETREQKKTSFEDLIKSKFDSFRVKDGIPTRSSREILWASAWPGIIDELRRSCETNKTWSLNTLSNYTGFSDSEEMRSYNIKKGIIPNAVQFFKKKSTPLVHII